MKRLTCNIEIGSSPTYTFKNVAEITVKSSFENLTDTAELTIPRKLEFAGKAITSDNGIFKRGDRIKISAGYDFDNKEIFSGYLVDIKPGTPISFRCEDEMFSLKTKGVKRSYKSEVRLEKLLADILPGVTVKAADVSLGKFRTEGSPTPAQILEGLRKEYLIKSFFRGGTLYAGLAFWPELQQTPAPVFTFQKDIIDHDLTYQDERDVKLKVEAISINPDNSKTTVEVGDSDGEKRTLHYYNKTTTELKKIAEADLKRFKYTGFRGKFTTFGEPLVNHGDQVELVDPNIPDRNGKYIVKEVERTFGLSGYRQIIHLEVKV